MELVIGDKLWSSWSMRPWLALKRAGLPFRETLVRLRREETAAEIAAAGSTTGKVPVLKTDEGLVIPDSLAICEWAAEQAPGAALWPADPAARALGRAAACEMHAGFPSIRGELSMDLKLSERRDMTEPTRAEIRRMVELWSGLRSRFAGAGPFLVGPWSIADAFFTPVATRFRSYGVALSDFGDTGAAGEYASLLLAQPEYLEWERAALQAEAPA
ncbi:MAG: glutathione S-transferase N-terminal domain-containing protein [Caulobacteraceae bacterium]|nr:glutathione S-transferase N-terminal domain-containing protein [Caulobacter sp.]